MTTEDLDAQLTEWIRVMDELGELEYDSNFEWRGETDDSVAGYLDDKRELQARAEDALVQAMRLAGVDQDRLLDRAREICRERKEKGYWGTDRCYASIRNAEGRRTDVPREQGGSGPRPVPPAAASEPEPSPPSSSGPYAVFVDENYNYMDSSGGYLLACFPDCESALAACRKIIDEFLARALEEKKTEGEIWKQYASFGEDPYIIVERGKPMCPFSGWDYARERIRELVAKAED